MKTQTKEEIKCAECFLQWYGAEYGLQYKPVRAEEIYRDLEGKPRWDFVAVSTCQHENDVEMAIEVKTLIRPHIRIQMMQWEKLFSQVTAMVGPISGTFLIYTRVRLNPPRHEKYHVLRLDHKKEIEFIKVLSGLILRAGPGMGIKEEVDLGPEIILQFPDWPKHPRKAYELKLMKWSEAGCCVKLGMSWDTYSPEPELRKAISSLDLTTQLGLAKKRGIKQTVLLLCCTIDWDPNVVKAFISGKEVDCAAVDTIYAVETLRAKISRVWP